MAAPDGEIERIITKHEKETPYQESDEVAGSCDDGGVYPCLTQFHRKRPFSDTASPCLNAVAVVEHFCLHNYAVHRMRTDFQSPVIMQTQAAG
jgi:hypothetical protein